MNLQKISIVAGYRNRDLLRVRRFLDSLEKQNDRNFELIFVDYGSDEPFSSEVSELCKSYHFCNYIFCDTRGWLWNRAHALNIGIHYASGTWFLSADIDLIYSRGTIARLREHLSEKRQIFCKAFLLPENFNGFDRLGDGPTKFPLTSGATIGLFQCVHINHLREVNGYDEYFRIWGFEDNDLAHRLEETGVQAYWLDAAASPIYHQWHPRSKEHFFMRWWWQDQSIYSAQKRPGSPESRDWGVLLRSEDRALNYCTGSLDYVCREKMNAFERYWVVKDVIDHLCSGKKELIVVNIQKMQKFRKKERTWSTRLGIFMIRMINRIFALFKLPMELRPFDAIVENTEESLLYFMYTLIIKSDLVADYKISEQDDSYIFKLLGRHNT